MSILVKIHWFNHRGERIDQTEYNSKHYTRERLVENIRYGHFDDMYMNNEIRRLVCSEIKSHSNHNNYIAVVADEIFREPFYILPKGRSQNGW